MKNLLGIVLVLVLVCSCAFAETVYVTIADDAGSLAMAAEAVTVTDADADGSLTIHDALISAHDLAFDGGSGAGYEALDQGYGLSINKLWGVENGGSYGYYVNNASAFSLLDPVADGDTLYAFVYTDLVSWSDTYCYFDNNSVEAEGSIDLVLNMQGYDADWNAVYLPVEGAVITVNGEDTAFVTDAEGRVSVTLDAGEYLISARSDTLTLVPPVCHAIITEAK